MCLYRVILEHDIERIDNVCYIRNVTDHVDETYDKNYSPLSDTCLCPCFDNVISYDSLYPIVRIVFIVLGDSCYI